ncbi:hypothetical protein G7Y89_g13486 [Cudoniella acicularis]|uniref:Glycosyltransferase family 69 protein n=1 Tax=Cudoniella acicularis TaxID=354080 RepID=A0A8H4RAK9_9HELO|nr:hypothetical protein G7Y89_g13486 [Cudoniella acicularis]
MRVSAKMPPAPSSYELLPRSSSDLDSSTSILEDESFIKDKPRRRGHRRQLSRFVRRARRICRFCRPLYVFVAFVVFIIWQLLFNASYANPPAFSIPEGETVFLAANIIDGGLITGAWGKSVVDFVELIGKERVFVSIYGGPTEALKKLETMLPCEKKLVSEDQHPLDLGAIPRTKLPTGESRIKRIAYLAEVRNKALEPLDEMKGRRFDKVLFINDVFFDAKDAARLLWGTNLNKDGESVYKAACGVDFVKWWKFYDTFATRDAEGYSLGIPIFPWFANVGEARSRKDLLEGRDNVRVKSCWGGMSGVVLS